METSESTQRKNNLVVFFATRMLIVASSTGLLFAVLPPVIYGFMAWERLEVEARQHAKHLASALTDVARKQPYLWRYSAEKVIIATSDRHLIKEFGTARITDCRGETIFSSEELRFKNKPLSGPAAWASIRDPNNVVAWVQVSMDGRHQWSVIKKLSLGSSLIGLLLGTLLFYLPTGVIRRQSQQLDETMTQLLSAESELVISNRGLQQRIREATSELRQLSRRVVLIQEEERGRIARDLHDGLGQLLTAMRLNLEQKRDGAEALTLCERSLAELRRAVRDLRPLELTAGSTLEVLSHTTERFEVNSGIPISFRCRGRERSLSDEVATCLFRVLQEALTNVGRHSEASEVGVTLTFDSDRVTLELRDDGRGFVHDAHHEGAGLHNMAERLKLLGGSFDFTTSPGAGTHICGVIPLAADSIPEGEG